MQSEISRDKRNFLSQKELVSKWENSSSTQATAWEERERC